MKQILKSTLVLVLITLIAGLSLATVYEVTKDPIAAAEKKARDDAYRMAMPNAKGFIAIGKHEESMYPIEAGKGVRINACLTATADQSETDVSTGTEYRVVGFVVNVTSSNGYGGDITLAVGVLRDGSIQGISVIAQSETAGLGAVCADKKFTDQFVGINNWIEYVKTGKTEANQIHAISGATITTSAVTEAVNVARNFVLENCMEGGTD